MSKLTRRQFSTLMVGGVAVVPIASLLSAGRAAAADLPLVDVESPTAKALQYVVKAEKEGVNCASCLLYADDGSNSQGACSIFPGASVPAEAWCSAYQARS